MPAARAGASRASNPRRRRGREMWRSWRAPRASAARRRRSRGAGRAPARARARPRSPLARVVGTHRARALGTVRRRRAIEVELGGLLALRVALQPALAKLVLLRGRKLAQPLVGLAGGAALLGGHLGPVAQPRVEALLLDRLQRRVAARRADEPLLLLTRHVVPAIGNG